MSGIDLKAYLANLEKDLISQALNYSDGVVARAAQRLHIRRTTLVEKMRKYHLQRKQSEEEQKLAGKIYSEENANKIKVSFSGKVNILCFYVRLNFAIIKDIVYSFTQFGFRF